MNLLLGITGSIAAYRAADLARLFIKHGDSVQVAMTSAAPEFITPLTLEALTGRNVYLDQFGIGNRQGVEHVELAKWCDLCLIAPATAATISRMAQGLAEDPVSTLYLACKQPTLLVPAMNTSMLDHPATRRNLELLRTDGVHIMEPDQGLLACGDIGRGKMPPVEAIFERAQQILHPRRDYRGLRVLVTAGPTQEPIDPVRVISNHSSGRMGYAIAQALHQRGAQVHLVTGPVHLPAPEGATVEQVQTACQMQAAVQRQFADCDILIKTAAVADMRPARPADTKLKKSTDAHQLAQIELTPNPDILAECGQQRQPGQFLVGFAAETHNLEQQALSKLQRKQIDLIVGNLVGTDESGFGHEHNRISIYDHNGLRSTHEGSKQALAHTLLDEIQQCRTSALTS